MTDYLTEGLHAGIDMQRYISDPCPEPSASAGALHTLLDRSPMHARLEHPRLGRRPDDDSTVSDIGSAAHGLLLGGESKLVGVDADDWRTKAAREARDEARAAGQIPLLARHMHAVEQMAASARQALVDRGIGDPVAEGSSEWTIIWRDGPTWCRCRPDILSPDFDIVVDYKTCADARPDKWARLNMGPAGADLQAAHVLRGLDCAVGQVPRAREYLWLVQESGAPYACSWVGLGHDLRELAERRRALALRIWAECMATGRWPGYSGTYWAESKPWEEAEQETREFQAARVAAEEVF